MLRLIQAIHQELKGTYGSPRMVRELRDRGFPASKERVERLMRENGIRARHKLWFKATTDSKHVLRPLVIAAGHDIGHALHVASSSLVEVTQVTLGAVFDAACRRPEQFSERREVRLKLVADRSGDRGNAVDILRPS